MDKNPQDNRYEQLYEGLRTRAEHLHERNRSMIKWGSIMLIVLPVILLIVRWLTDSDKMVFMLIWIFCLFALAAFLIGVEYLDHTVSRNVKEMTGGEEEFDSLLHPRGIKGDFKRLTSSVVPIIVVAGLVIVPCLYAWFNIFSNWDPYTTESTGRVQVAVANQDEGADLLGLNINVGEKITDELSANDDIGWTIVSKKKALEGLYAGDYYAAVVIPEDFSRDALSFTTGDLTNPELEYYENVKKNAIAPKITGKAEDVLKDEVNAAFIETIGKYLSEAKAVADASDLDPADVFTDLGDRIGLLSERMDDLVALVTAARGLSDAADELLSASASLSDSTGNVLSTGKKVLEDEESLLPETQQDAKNVSDSIHKETKTIASGLDQLHGALSAVSGDMDAFNQFVADDLEAQKKLVKDMADSASAFADRLSDMGLSGLAARFTRLAKQLNGLSDELAALKTADESTWEQIKEKISGLLDDIQSAEDTAQSISEDTGTQGDDKISQAISDTRKTIQDIQNSIDTSNGSLKSLESALAKSEKALHSLDGGLDLSVSSLIDMRSGFRALSGLFDTLANSEDMNDLNALLTDGTEVISEKLATPIEMKTETIYPVQNFGSMMAPFYTILSQWVIALFAAVLINARSRRKDSSLREQYFGRFRLFLALGLAQALLVSLGDLLYVGIQCHHPILFVIAACVNGLVFMMINFALAFALGKVGAAISVVIVILQVAGAGGTFPPEVLPGFFRALYPFMPFHYALDAMRECVAGMYGATYFVSLGILLLMGAVVFAAGLVFGRQGGRFIRFLTEGMEKSELIE
ncbi:MAG: YhgE/Pip domain-containing protein [Firmicutes bacterium]|nr:YhgE/Pip domain-containing protein [Bacillota bacterium]